MPDDSTSDVDLADQLDHALSSMRSGNACALEELIAALDRGDEVDAAQGLSNGAVSHDAPAVGAALQKATIRLSQSTQNDWTPDIPGYELQRELGQGGMGVVWLARQQSLGRLVALKVLPHAMTFSPRLRSRFQTETRAIAKVRHPNIVDVYDVIESAGVLAYAMEWVEGSTLAKVIERAREGDTSRHGQVSSMNCVREALGWPPGGSEVHSVSSGQHAQPPRDRSYIVFVCRVGVAIARALGAVHRAGLVHRDVKPSNILLRRDGTPLLSDFGLVRDPDSTLVTQAGATGIDSFAGTAAYAAPEQLRSERSAIDSRADIYSLGVTLYSALALRVPFEGHSHLDVLRHIQQGLCPPLRKAVPKVPGDLQTIVSRAMELEPAARYQTADEMADDLERLLNLQPIKAKPAGVLKRGIKLVRRKRSALVAATLGGVLALGLVALTLVYFLGFPIWSKAHLDQARLALLDPEHSDSLFSAFFWNQEHPHGMPISPRGLNLAREHYDGAARYSPFDGNLALERDLVRLARDILQRDATAPIAFRQSDQLPLTAAFATTVCAQWVDHANPRKRLELGDAQLRATSPIDLRSLGLLALLCGEQTTSMAAWTALDLQDKPDALVEASFGVIYLISERPGRAYPRLRQAVEAFPNTKFLTVYLAEAAARCGDLEKAQLWLDQARSMKNSDRFNGISRVQAGIFAAAGNDVEARRLYEELLAENMNIVAFYQYAEFLESRGELKPALELFKRVIDHGIEHRNARRRFVDLMERWWGQLSTEQRGEMAQAAKGSTNEPGSVAALMQTYDQSIERLGDRPGLNGFKE